MIKFENTEVVGWEAAIRGMRNPKNSWDRSDSLFVHDYNSGLDKLEDRYIDDYLGSNDLDLMKRLAAGGPVHAKYRRMIIVYVDITAPLYWWKEFDTYKVGTVANSCSTMHKIADKEFEWDDFSIEHLYDEEITEETIQYNPSDLWFTHSMLNVINHLNTARERYLETKDKKYWWQMIQLLPSSYNQKRTVMMNYEVLAGIYPMRKNHKLDEWSEHEPDLVIRQGDDVHYMYPYHGFCDWIKTLPYSELITGPRDIEAVELFADGNKVTTLENELTPDLLLKKYTPNQVRKASGYSPIVGCDMSSQPDFSSCMNPSVEEEIYIENILTRADVMWYSDMINGSRVVKSKNTKEPLTEKEQKCLERMWRDQGFEGDVIFYVGEEK